MPNGAKSFKDFTESLAIIEWPQELEVRQIEAPQGLAPHSIAYAADVIAGAGNRDRGTGRLIFLEDDSEPAGWGGTRRAIIFAQSPIEPGLGGDDELAAVAWSWLIDELKASEAEYVLPSATVTRIVSAGFGELAKQGKGSQLEVRGSWSPTGNSAAAHAEAWARFVCQVAGFTPQPTGVASLGH